MDIKERKDGVRDAAVIMNNTLLAGRETVMHADREFINNCLYLAEYEANKRFDGNVQVRGWHEHYVGVFWRHGWTFEQDPVGMVQRQFSGSVQQAWMNSAGRLVTLAQRSHVEAALAALEANAQLLKKFTALEGNIHKSHIVPMRYDARGDLSVVLSSVTLRKLVLTTTYLFWKVHQPLSQLDIHARKLVISRRNMDAHRASVEEAILQIPYPLDEVAI